jgi:hypothetical protein
VDDGEQYSGSAEEATLIGIRALIEHLLHGVSIVAEDGAEQRCRRLEIGDLAWQNQTGKQSNEHYAVTQVTSTPQYALAGGQIGSKRS